MRIRALYTKRSLSVIRRLITPLSTLAQRGVTATMMQTERFEPGLGLGQDLVLLSDEILSDEDLARLQQLCLETTVCYDLSSPALLAHAQVTKALGMVPLVTVPTASLSREVETMASRVGVLPSLVDIPYFMTAHKLPAPSATRKVIGCFGEHDWEIVRPALEQLAREKPRLVLLGDEGARDVLGDLLSSVSGEPDSYPAALRATLFGLCPRHGHDSRDCVVAYEYGILCRPVIASAPSTYASELKAGAALFVENSTDAWTSAITDLLGSSSDRAALGNALHARAKAFSGPQLAKTYGQFYGKYVLPTTVR